MPIINGRLVDKDFMSGDEIIKTAAPGAGRRVVIRKGFNAYTVERNKDYHSRDLTDKKGRPVHIETIPDRTKGSHLPNQRIAPSV